MEGNSPGESVHKRRCIIKKLDFENCIVTNIKTKSRGRKRLRARITRKVEDSPEDRPVDEQLDTTIENANSQSQKSPVLNRKIATGRESPVFLKIKKNKHSKKANVATTKNVPSPSSPVFKLFKKNKTQSECEEFETIFNRTTTESVFEESGLESCYQIDETTTQESKESSIKISSVESVRNRSGSSFSVETSTRRNSSGEFLSNSFLEEKSNNSPNQSNRRNYKKNSLLGRLQKLQQKQASEKLLWQHQNRRNSSTSLKLAIITVWKEEFNFFFKCKSLAGDLETVFLIVDSRWIPNIKNVKKTSVIQVHPPWQKLTVEDLNKTVLINIICLDILDEEAETPTEQRTFEIVAAEKFEIENKPFIDSLFCSNTSGFLC